MQIHVVTNYLNLLSVLIILLVALVAALIVMSTIRKERIARALEASVIEANLNNSLKQKCESLEQTIQEIRLAGREQEERYKSDIEMLKGMAKLQEKRLYRAELETQRKSRLLLYARREVEIMQGFVTLLMPLLQECSAETKGRADSLLQQLTDFRVSVASEQRSWEDAQEAFRSYLGDDVSLATLESEIASMGLNKPL